MSTPDQVVLEEDDAKPSNARLIFRLVLFVILVVGLVYVLTPDWKRVMQWGLGDNDDAMRVLQVRDWLAGQAWFDVSQHRLNPPNGGDMHWSRIADLPLASFMLPLTAIFGAEWGAKYATFFTPIALAFVYFWVGTRTAISLGGQKAFLPSILLVTCAPAALSYFVPGRVDHHGLQLIFIISAIWGLFARGPKAAAYAGFAIAAGICIGLESLPVQIVLIGWVAARWGLKGSEVKSETIAFGLGFAFSLCILFAVTVPVSKWNLPTNDAIGRGYVVLGCAGGVLLALAATFLSGFKFIGRLVGLVLVGVVVLSGIAIFPEIIIPPYGRVDPLLKRLWLQNVNETIPLIKTEPARLLAFAAFPFLAAIGALLGVALSKGPRREMWILASIIIVVVAALAIFWQTRVAGLATAVSSIFVAAMIAQVAERWNWRIALIFGLIVNPTMPTFISTAIEKLMPKPKSVYQTGGGQNCFSQRSFGALNAQPTGLVVAPIDMGARILLTTKHSALAAPYHRNNEGNLAAYRIFLAPEAQAKQQIDRLGAKYVAICKKSAELVILSREGPGGLMANLKDGKAPSWLTLLPTPQGSDVLTYQVKQAP